MSFMDEVKNNTANRTTTASSYTFDLSGQHSAGGTYGWICPVCGRGVAPDQKYCGCKPQPTPIYPSYPTYPFWWYKVTCDTTGNPPNAATSYTTTSASTKTEV